MRNISKLFFSLILLANTSFAAPLGNTLFTITPSITNLNLPSNGNSSVLYTITNNATKSVTPTITPGYQSAGNHLTMAANTCDSVLASNASCTFRVLMSGAGQPSHFTITPRVCSFNGFMCSVAGSAVAVTVNTPAAGLPARAYEEVINTNTESTTLIGININNTSDIISSSLNFTNNVNSVVVSPDGSKVYAAQTDHSGTASVAFFNVMSDALILTRAVIIPDVTLYKAPANSVQMAITPDGSALFITKYANILSHSKKTLVPSFTLFRIDLTSDDSIATAIQDSDHILVGARGLVVSPDSKTVYVGTNTDYIVQLPVTADSVNASNKVAEGIPADNHIGLAIDPAGNKLYVGNESEGSVSILAINGAHVNVEQTILNSGGFTGASGLAVSPDGATLYVAERDNDSVLAVPLSNPDASLVQPGITASFGLGLSANGSKLYVTQAQDSVNTTTVLDAINFFATPTVIAIDGMSLTIGQFIGA